MVSSMFTRHYPPRLSQYRGAGREKTGRKLLTEPNKSPVTSRTKPTLPLDDGTGYITGSLRMFELALRFVSMD